MIFAIDVGNTHLVAGCMEEAGARKTGRFATDTKCTAEEYAIKFRIWLELVGIAPEEIDGAIICTVVPPLATTLMSSIRILFGIEAMVVGPGLKTGLNIKIDNPAQLGADMVAGAVASIERYPLPQVVFDLGTATTASVIDRNGVFRGCLIMAGVRTALSTLVENTSQLPMISLSGLKHTVGTNSVDSMRAGSVLGAAAMMDGIAERIEEELGEKAVLVATGGLSSYILPHCKRDFIRDDDLVLRGLWQIYQKNS